MLTIDVLYVIFFFNQLQNERQNLMSRLLDAVKQCQVRFGGKTELATETDSRVSCLCSSWEAVLQHGMKHTNKTLSTLKQMTEITGLNKIGTGISLLDNVETEPVYWLYVKHFLSKHDIERYMRLSKVTTDAGRGRAWIRSSLNEHSLEKYMHMVIENDSIIRHYYEDWAFIRDQEKRNTLPNMAAGLCSILFAINIDNEELNTIRPPKGLDELLSVSTLNTPLVQPGPQRWEHYRPVIGGEDLKDKRKDKKKKKKVPKIVSFDDVEYAASVKNHSSSPASPKAIVSSIERSGYNNNVTVSLPTSPHGFVIESGRGNISGGSVLQSQDSVSSCDTTSLGEADTVYGRNNISGNRKPRSYSLSETNGLLDKNGTDSSDMMSNMSVSKASPPHDVSDIYMNGAKSESKKENIHAAPLENKNTHLKRIFNFGSSSDQLDRSSSRTSLDSVHSSKSELAVSVNPSMENNLLSQNKKGHRKSLSDTSMLVTNFGSRIFKTVVEETKKRFSIGENEGSLPSSKASSTRSLNEQNTGVFPTPTNADVVEEAIEVQGDVILEQGKKISPKTVVNSSSSHSSLSNVPTVYATVGGMDNITDTNHSVQKNSVQTDSHAKRDYVQNHQTKQKVKAENSGSFTNKNCSETSLPLFENLDYNSEPAITSDLIPLSAEGIPLEETIFRSIARDSPCSQDNTSSSVDSYDFQSYTETTQQATLALALAQKGFLSSDMKRTQGDGSNFPDGVVPNLDTPDGMTSNELKEAIIAMMVRKDEVEDQNRNLRFAMEAELEVSTALRMEIDEMKKAHMSRQERDADKIKDISRENDLLKHQLRKYVSAVQLLRRQGARDEDFPGIHLDDQVQPPVPPSPFKRDYSHEAEEYEKKLIQVAEMHGELMEFNEMLHKQLIFKEALVKRLQQELTDLRGPLPTDIADPDDDMSIISELDGDYINRPLINIWIPSAFLKGKPSDGYHVYQVYIRIRDEEWNIYRRYTEFLDLHMTLKKNSPIVATFEFPPKKAIGNKEAKFVESRRKKLQVYLRKVINFLSQSNPEFTSGINRYKLTKAVHFFGDQHKDDKKSKGRRKSTSNTGAVPQNTQRQQQQQPHYSGL